jgi:very-short-patch-repair endonuclease
VGPELRKDVSQRQIDHACKLGVLERRFRDVYIDPSVAWSPLQDLAAAVAAGGRLSAAGHRSAAALWGILPDFPAIPEIVVPGHRRPRMDRVVAHRFTDLRPEHIILRHGIRVLNPLVVIVVLGSVVGPEVVAEAIIRADSLRLFRPIAVRAELGRIARCGRDGVTAARQALDMLPVGDRPSDGMLELWYAELSRSQGLPSYTFQHSVRIDGRVIRIDFAYPAQKVAIEVDDYDSHGSLRGFLNDARRQNLLVLDGWLVLRVTWWDIRHEPNRVAAQVRDALRASSDK